MPVEQDIHAVEEDSISVEPRINDRIRVAEVRLVGPNGEQVGIVPIARALDMALQADLDLVEVAPTARPPVVKIMDYGKFKYEAAQKAREARRNQVLTVIKEMKLRPKIDGHDYETKKGHVVRFLKAGDKVKVTIMFRGREQSRPELGIRLLQKLAGDVADLGFVESAPKLDGRNMIMVLAPHKSAQRPVRPAASARTPRPALEPTSALLVEDDDETAAPETAAPETAAPETAPAESPAPAASTAPAEPIESVQPTVPTSPTAPPTTRPSAPAAARPASSATRAPATRPPAPRPQPSTPTPSGETARVSPGPRPSASPSPAVSPQPAAATPAGGAAAKPGTGSPMPRPRPGSPMPRPRPGGSAN